MARPKSHSAVHTEGATDTADYRSDARVEQGRGDGETEGAGDSSLIIYSSSSSCRFEPSRSDAHSDLVSAVIQ